MHSLSEAPPKLGTNGAHSGRRVAVEVAKDPTDHNLWPFELVYGFVLSLAGVLPGLLIGALVRRARI